MPFVLSVYIIIDINVLCVHAHMVPHNATAFILARTTRHIVLKIQVWKFFLNEAMEPSQRPDTHRFADEVIIKIGVNFSNPRRN